MNVLVKILLDLLGQHDMFLGAKLILNLLQLLHLEELLLLESFKFKLLLAFFQHILSHLHGLFKVLITVLEDLFERLLVE